MSVSSRWRTFRMSLSRRTPMGHQVSFSGPMKQVLLIHPARVIRSRPACAAAHAASSPAKSRPAAAVTLRKEALDSSRVRRGLLWTDCPAFWVGSRLSDPTCEEVSRPPLGPKPPGDDGNRPGCTERPCYSGSLRRWYSRVSPIRPHSFVPALVQPSQHGGLVDLQQEHLSEAIGQLQLIVRTAADVERRWCRGTDQFVQASRIPRPAMPGKPGKIRDCRVSHHIARRSQRAGRAKGRRRHR